MATVRVSAFCGAIVSNNPFEDKDNQSSRNRPALSIIFVFTGVSGRFAALCHCTLVAFSPSIFANNGQEGWTTDKQKDRARRRSPCITFERGRNALLTAVNLSSIGCSHKLGLTGFIANSSSLPFHLFGVQFEQEVLSRKVAVFILRQGYDAEVGGNHISSLVG